MAMLLWLTYEALVGLLTNNFNLSLRCFTVNWKDVPPGIEARDSSCVVN